MQQIGRRRRAAPRRGAISGAKNAVLPILCATLLADEPVSISNVPHLHDVVTTAKLLAGLGAGITIDQGTIGRAAKAASSSIRAASTATSRPTNWSRPCAPRCWCSARCWRNTAPRKCRCPVAARSARAPVDQHLKGMQALGAVISVDHGFIKAHTNGRLKGGRVVFDMASVGATENVLMAACLAQGTSVIENAAMEPEIVDLAECLIALGADIEGAGSGRIIVRGVERLHGGTHACCQTGSKPEPS
jgi:UDP-N-acetylglucosamine 1-carboxyvinyltransferase